jgi:hypothetical protein
MRARRSAVVGRRRVRDSVVRGGSESSCGVETGSMAEVNYAK